MVEELVPQMSQQDEWLVVGDGVHPEAESLCKKLDHRVVFFQERETRRNGNLQRDRGIEEATGDVLVFFDDSIWPALDALDKIRSEATTLRPCIFRMDLFLEGKFWKQKWLHKDWKLEAGQVSGCQFVPPNDKSKLGSWMAAEDVPATPEAPPGFRRASAYFIADTMKHYSHADWSESVILTWRGP